VMIEYITNYPSQTKKLGGILANKITKIKSKREDALVFGLEGDLGGGKTTFLQGFAKGLGIKEKVLSPTFILMKRFKISHLAIKPFNYFYHIDCYRVQKTKEILDLGFKKIISDPKNIVVIEWADKIRKILPKDTFWVKFSIMNKGMRKITFLTKSIVIK